MRHMLSIILAFACLAVLQPSVHAAPKAGKANKASKERLVLMPLRVPDEDKSLAGSMETALVEGMQQKYEVFSGEQVAQKAKAIFLKESKNTSKKDCDETRCMQDIAEAFQAELIATANVTKRPDGYFLALNVQNIFDNKVVYSKSMPCKNCDAYEVVEKLKELSGVIAQATPQPENDGSNVSAASNAESELWNEVQKGSGADDYQAYLGQYPKGKFVALAKSRLTKFNSIIDTESIVQKQSDLDGGSMPSNKTSQVGKVFKDCIECTEMVVIPSGSFNMGSDNGAEKEKPVHQVIIKSFALGKTEVTQGQWKYIMGSNPSEFKNCGDSCPVDNVSWYDVKEYIQKLNAKTGKQYRLPSEAEWEYACRAGVRQEYCGSDTLDSVAWYGAFATPLGNSAKTTNLVAIKQANAFGLYDMSGNLWEWTEDSYHGSYHSAPTDGGAWQGDGVKRVLRGGSWETTPTRTRAANRNGGEPSYGNSKYGYVGFRLVRMLP